MPDTHVYVGTDTGLRGQALAAEVLRRIREHPETHNQESWIELGCPTVDDLPYLNRRYVDPLHCGSTACTAGHAIYAAGGHAVRLGGGVQWVHPSVGAAESVLILARKLLQLSSDEAQTLFMYADEQDAVNALQEYVDTGSMANWLAWMNDYNPAGES